MSCTCGSQKQSTAPDTINTVNIGALCFLFGIEGALCRILDLVPETIKAIASLNPDIGNADDIFRNLLKKVTKTGYGIVIDEVTGNIDLASFCASPPPPIPDDINYYDIYSFIGELVPILERFFKFNDILQGNSTGLLDKIIKFWLYKQWFEHCECSQCSPPDPTNLPETIYPPYNPQQCPDGSTRCKNLRIATPDPNGIYDGTGGSIQFGYSCEGFFAIYSTSENLTYIGNQSFVQRLSGAAMFPIEDSAAIQAWYAIKESGAVTPPFPVGSGVQFYYKEEIFYEPIYRNYVSESNGQLFFDNGSGNFKPVAPNNAQGGVYAPCPSSTQTPPPPPEFCELFPYDPNCNQQPDECESDYVICGEFIDCNALLRKPVTRSLIKDGDIKQVSISEFVDCESQRTSKEIDYLECAVVIPPVYGCTDSNASNYNPNANADDGSCEYLGCTDPNASNYNPNANTDDGSCQYVVYGCTEVNASNYNFHANADDGSCEYLGCTDPNAINYNPNAQTDDGSCQY